MLTSNHRAWRHAHRLVLPATIMPVEGETPSQDPCDVQFMDENEEENPKDVEERDGASSGEDAKGLT